MIVLIEADLNASDAAAKLISPFPFLKSQICNISSDPVRHQSPLGSSDAEGKERAYPLVQDPSCCSLQNPSYTSQRTEDTRYDRSARKGGDGVDEPGRARGYIMSARRLSPRGEQAYMGYRRPCRLRIIGGNRQIRSRYLMRQLAARRRISVRSRQLTQYSQKKNAIALPSVRDRPRYIGLYHVTNDSTPMTGTYITLAPISALHCQLACLGTKSTPDTAYPPSAAPDMRSKIHPTRFRMSVTARASHWV